MSKTNIVTSTPAPNLIGQPDVQFRSEDFDALVYSKGYELIHEKAASCPCRTKSNGSPLSNCQNCGGTGWILFNPNVTRMVLQSMNMQTRYKEWSKENLGTVAVTSRAIDVLGYMDRLTVKDSDAVFSQVLFPYQYSGQLFAFTIYDIINVHEIFLFESATTPLRRLNSSEYSFTKNKLILNDSFVDIQNLTISIRYKHWVSYHIIDLVKETRRSYINNSDTKGKDQNTVLPFHAVARRSHYILDQLNFEGDNILDNSYQR